MNINALNIGRNEENLKTNSINIKNNLGAEAAQSGGVAEVFENVMVASAEKMTSTQVDSRTVSSFIDDLSSVEDQIKESAQTAKASLKALFNKMTGTDCVKMDEDGYDLNSMDTEKIVTVVDRIKIMLATYCEDYEAQGASVDMSEIKEVVGNTGMADKVAAKLKESDIPQTTDNIDEVKSSLTQASEITPLSENAKNYLVSNKLEPSIKNIYKAEHAVAAEATTTSQSVASQLVAANKNNQANGITEQEWKQLMPQVEAVINRAGLENNDKNINNARAFVENGIPVTEENLLYKNELDNLDLTDMDSPESIDRVLDKITDTMKLGNKADTTLLTDERSDIKTISDAIMTVNRADLKETAYLADNNQEFTIANLRSALDAAGKSGYTSVTLDMLMQSIVQTVVQPGAQATQIQATSAQATQIQTTSAQATAISDYRQLEEIRILMTADAGAALIKQGFNLDTTPIAKLVEELKGIEAELYGDDAETVLQVQKAVNDIKNSPDVVIGAVISDESSISILSIATFSQMGNSLKQRFRQAEQTYDAVGTEVRADLGDSVSKAVAASTDSVLAELGLEDTKANRDAVRILAYNGMEMTKQNIDNVKDIYGTLNSIIDNMKPETVLSMIKDGINPMNADIKDVNEYLVAENEKNENADAEDKFSKFLYKLERTEGISEQDREKFIGIYRMMNIFRKDAGRAVGALLKQDAEISMSNLISAYNSSKAAGIDVTVDESTGLGEVSGAVNYFNSLFASSAESITPKSLKSVNDEKAIERRSVENFCEAVNEAYDPAEESGYYEEYINQISSVAEAEDSVLRQLVSGGQQVSINNIMAMQNIMNNDYFKKYMNLGSSDESDTENTGDIIGHESTVADILSAFVEKSDSSESMNEAYDAISEEVSKAVTEAMESETPEYKDIENLRMMGKEIGLLKNLAQRNDFRVPFVAGDEVGTINLKIVEDAADRGRIAIRFSTSELGNVSIEGRISGEKAGIFAVTDGDEAKLQEKLDSVLKDIGSITGVNECSLEVSHSDQVPALNYTNYNSESNEVSLKTLYGFAKSIIVGVMKTDLNA